jgi:hypothetical protein
MSVVDAQPVYVNLLKSLCCRGCNVHECTNGLCRCFGAWRGRVLRRQQLQELEAQAQLVSAQAAGRAALRAWLQVRALALRLM